VRKLMMMMTNRKQRLASGTRIKAVSTLAREM
jgi:hypothetical protein